MSICVYFCAMWQRIQTVFLSISALSALMLLFLPIAQLHSKLYAKDDIPTASLAVAILLTSLFAISQFKNRKLQIRLCLISIVFSLGLLIAIIFAANILTEWQNFNIAAGLPIIIIICQLLAIRNIRKDDKLVKSMDRFR